MTGRQRRNGVSLCNVPFSQSLDPAPILESDPELLCDLVGGRLGSTLECAAAARHAAPKSPRRRARTQSERVKPSRGFTLPGHDARHALLELSTRDRAKLMTFAGLRAANTVARWHREGGKSKPGGIVEQVTEQLVGTIKG